MKTRISIFAFALFCVACGPVIPSPTAEITPLPRPTFEPRPTVPIYPTPLTAQNQPEPVSEEPAVQRTNWLLLGRDWRAHREGTGRGFQTDVIVLVSVLETDPIQVTAIQYPRNLYVPVPGYLPTWLFSVWKDYGWQGLHDWWGLAFGIPLQGIFMIDMDNFVAITDQLGVDGVSTLAFLRDNQATWGLGGYDEEERVFQVLQLIWSKSQSYFLSNPIVAANAVLTTWDGMIQSDLSAIQQLVYVFDLGWKIRSNAFDTHFVQLEEPTILRSYVPEPLNVDRGMIANADLIQWHACVLDWSCSP